MEKVWWSIHFETRTGGCGDTAESAESPEEARELFRRHHPGMLITEITIDLTPDHEPA